MKKIVAIALCVVALVAVSFAVYGPSDRTVVAGITVTGAD